MKALVGIDGSERSFDALQFASRLMSPEADEITLYFSPPRFRLAADSQLDSDVPALAREALGKTVFDQAKSHLDQRFLSCTSNLLGDNKPVDGILAAANHERADLIVVGAHSATRRIQFFVGGVTRAVVHRASLPVLVVREGIEDDRDQFKVMVACDDKTSWHDALDALSSFTWPSGTTGKLFHVVESIDPDQLAVTQQQATIPGADRLVQEYRESIDRRKVAIADNLSSACPQLPEILKNTTPDVSHGHVVKEIVKKVHDEHFDLVVVGARPHGLVQRLLGSTTEGLLIQCSCSLLIVHPQARP